MLTKGEIIAALVALGFKGSVGPMGGEDPEVYDNRIVLYSQCPEVGYQFNDDCSVDIYYPVPEDVYNSLINDLGYTEEEAQEQIDNPGHYDNVVDFLITTDDGWFFYFGTEHPDIVKAVKAVVAIKEAE